MVCFVYSNLSQFKTNGHIHTVKTRQSNNLYIPFSKKIVSFSMPLLLLVKEFTINCLWN